MENKELVMDLLDQLIDAMDDHSADAFKPKGDGVVMKETKLEGLPVEGADEIESGDPVIADPEGDAVDMGSDEKTDGGMSVTPMEEEDPNAHRMLKRMKMRM